MPCAGSCKFLTAELQVRSSADLVKSEKGPYFRDDFEPFESSACLLDADEGCEDTEGIESTVKCAENCLDSKAGISASGDLTLGFDELKGVDMPWEANGSGSERDKSDW